MSTGAESGSFALERGGKAYEFTNHPLASFRTGPGNVLANFSDKKLGQDTNTDDIADFYHPETWMLTDYYPVGMSPIRLGGEMAGMTRESEHDRDK